MKWDSERIIFNSEWNYFVSGKGPVKQKPGEKKGKKRKRKRYKEKRGRKGKEGRRKEK